MTPFSLTVTISADADIRRCVAYLGRERGAKFAETWAVDLAKWLGDTAGNGAVLGTRHPTKPNTRTFPYRHQATILAELTETDLRIIRIYFPGQDRRG